MKNPSFDGSRTIRAFVRKKLHRLSCAEPSFSALFEMMFSERDNIMYEKSEGYRIKRTTYGEARRSILEKTDSLRVLLHDVPSGSVVGLHMQNGLEWIETFWILLRCGYCPLLMNLRLDDDTLESALSACRAQAVISDKKKFSIKTILYNQIEAGPEDSTPVTFAPEILLMSSGTSANLKICSYTAEEFYYQIHDSYQIITQSKQIQKHYEGNLKLLTFLPFYHIFGLVAVYIWFAFFSRTFVQLNDLQPLTIVNTVRRHKVTHIFAVPLFWEKVYQQAIKTIRERGEETYNRFNKAMHLAGKLSDTPILGSMFRHVAFREVRENLFGESIRFMISGGSFIQPQTIEFFNTIGYHLANGYGMTEIGITSVELSRKTKMLNACYVGRPLPSVEYRIDENGELHVRSQTQARYVIEGKNTSHRDGWFNTHDLAECQKGHYRILGRSDDLVTASNGENLNPNRIEPRLNLPGIKEICLIQSVDDGCTTPILLVSVPQFVSESKLSELKHRLEHRLNDLNLSGQINKMVFTSDSLMLEQEFKLNRRRLTEDYRCNRLSLVVPMRDEDGGTDDALLLQIRDIFATALNKSPDEVSNTADFFLDEGGTSLDYFAMLAQLQEVFSISLDGSNGKSLNCVQSLYEFITQNFDQFG